MSDPLEGVSASGTIRTGAGLDRIAQIFTPVLGAAVSAIAEANEEASVFIYGSVATGMARPPNSDVDLLTVELPPAVAARLSRALSDQFSGLCRAVAIAAAQHRDFSGDHDEAYGGRVFLRHYCVHLAGPNPYVNLPDFAADARAARGFNGDIAKQAARWRVELSSDGDPARLGRRLARKTLLAVGGLVSVHDGTWTTDRTAAATRWGEIEPHLANELQMLLRWACNETTPDRQSIEAVLDGIVAQVVASFDSRIGLWHPEQ